MDLELTSRARWESPYWVQTLDKSNIITHPDSKNDLALFSIGITGDIYDFIMVPLERSMHEGVVKKWEPGLGDEVTVVGLYTSHYGEIKNRPIIRIGHIAAMPEEPVRTQNGIVAGYLIEMRSIAGLSGSPVFLNTPRVRVSENNQLETLSKPLLFPIGMHIGYHVVESKEDQIAVPQFQQRQGVRATSTTVPDEKNTGFGVVIPIERIFEIMELERMVKSFDFAHTERLKKSGFVPTSAVKSEPSTKADNTQHKEDFTRLVGVAAKTPKPSE